MVRRNRWNGWAHASVWSWWWAYRDLDYSDPYGDNHTLSVLRLSFRFYSNLARHPISLECQREREHFSYVCQSIRRYSSMHRATSRRLHPDQPREAENRIGVSPWATVGQIRDHLVYYWMLWQEIQLRFRWIIPWDLIKGKPYALIMYSWHGICFDISCCQYDYVVECSFDVFWRRSFVRGLFLAICSIAFNPLQLIRSRYFSSRTKSFVINQIFSFTKYSFD